MPLAGSTRFILAGLVVLGMAATGSHPTAAHAASGSRLIAASAADTGVPSTGCGHPWTGGSDVSGTLSYGSIQRTYLLHVPSGYTTTTPTMLVLNLHGSGMTSAQEAGLTHMSATADARHFIVVYPQGTTVNGSTGWNAYPAGSPIANPYSNVNDAGFLTALVSSLEAQLCIDTTRVDLTGMSLGAVMSYRLACSDIPWIAAIAPVDATIPQSQGSCAMAHPTPLLAMNGQLDPLVWYNAPFGFGPSIPLVVGTWAQAVGCHLPSLTPFAQGDVVETAYTSCTNGADTELYTVTDGGHTWPGGFQMPWFGVTTTVIDASSLIATFFAAHPN